MQTQKTTSFSKILANKNSNNNPAQQVLATQQEAINSSPNPFFIDQTKANFLLQNYHKNLGDTFSRLDELNEEEEEEEEEDFDDQGLDEELDNSNLEFSDHAGVYQLLNEYQDFDFDVKQFGKYDIGQLKKNYQLTFGKKSKMMRENDEDSLVFSSLNTAQKFNLDDYANNGHESYEDDLYDDEDNDDQANESVDPTSSYLDQISRDILFVNNTGDHSQLMDENILNWSMKLSSHDQFAKRSRSRSPKRAKQWKNFANFQSQNRLLSTQFQNFNQLKNFQQLKLEQEQSQSQQYNKKSLSTTSWGKLKNSKSNSSNIGLSNQSIANSNEESHFSNFNNENSSYGSKSVNSSHFAYSLASNPHLYKVYQNSKGNLNSSNLDETATSTSGSDLSFQLANHRQSRTVPQETQSAKKTSFSQLKQRSVSSCAIAANAQPIDNSTMKKSIGIQHEPEGADGRLHDHSSTILCMVVDKNGKLNKKDLLMAAAKAKAMADQAGMLKIQRPKTPASSKRSSSLFNSKHSLPDLTFLTHYSDKKAEPSLSTPITKPSPPNPQSAPSDLLKRKTLKSIKRYRQTKQNTEPCAIQMAEQAQHLNTEETTEFKFERRTSLPFNKRGKNPLHPLNGKQPLKSCLKRKESHLKHSQSLQNNFVQDESSLAKSAYMFVPFVGHLFSCDTDSSTRYMYYNNLEKSRLSKMYKQLTGQLYEDEEENGEEDAAKPKQPEITKSDNDLRIKKAVKFKAVRPREPPHVPRPAPLLQYDTLIAMLKSSKEKKSKIVSGLGGKNSNAIEADSISMASLSESPPSEFKFSDDEDNCLVVKTNPSQSNKAEHVKNLKRNFHTILLKDQKLNNLKEILLELKTHQEKQAKFDPTHCSSTTSSASFSANSSSTSTCSSITSPLNTSLETKESIEKLAGYLFDFLKQSLKPPSTDCLLPTSNIFKSTIDSPLLSLKKPNQLAESNTLTQTFSQYTQMWNLIECTMNANLELQRQPIKSEGPAPKCYFFLPKEAYLTMFQEINKFASSTNQTYLIDNSINTSQLRRKHHFMVMLMSLKFKFQLFVIYLLNHKQLANWFEHVNRDKNVLKNFYDFKQSAAKGIGNNSSGDSGMGTEFMQVSTSSSTSASSLSVSTTNFHSPNTTVNEANFSVKSLSNISVFENEEYFSYFHKLLLQFNQLDLKLQTHSNETIANRTQLAQTPPSVEKAPTPPTPQAQKPPLVQTPVINRPKNSDSRLHNNRNHIPKPVINNIHPSIPKSSTNFYHTGNNQHHNAGHHSHSGFNLKNISKRFNIKSWFTSSSSNTNIPTSASHNNFTTHNVNSTGSRLPFGIKTLTPSHRNEHKNFKENVKKKLSRDSNTSKCCDVNTTGVLGSGVGALCNNSNSFMKHSLSEPSLNAILDR